MKEEEAGEYLSLVKAHFNQAAEVGEEAFQTALASEQVDLEILELKSAIQNSLFNRLIQDPDLPQLAHEAPIENIREQAHDFISSKEDENVGYPQTSLLSQMLADLQLNGQNSEVYRQFKVHYRAP